VSLFVRLFLRGRAENGADYFCTVVPKIVAELLRSAGVSGRSAGSGGKIDIGDSKTASRPSHGAGPPKKRQ
jgi:hypothetical protein